MYIHMSVSTHVHTYTCLHTHIRTYTCLYTHTSVHTRLFTHTCTQVRIRILPNLTKTQLQKSDSKWQPSVLNLSAVFLHVQRTKNTLGQRHSQNHQLNSHSKYEATLNTDMHCVGSGQLFAGQPSHHALHLVGWAGSHQESTFHEAAT